MRIRYLGLIALVLALATGALAQGLSQALPSIYEPISLLTAQNVPIGATGVTSVAISDPSEIVSIDYDSTATANVGPLTITVTYSDTETGSFAAGVDTVSQGGMNTITLNTTPTSGADFKAYNAKWAKFKLTNAGTATMPLLRMTGLRRRINANFARPMALVDRVLNLGLDATTLTNGSTSGFSSAFSRSSEFLSFFWDTSGSVGTRELQFYFSNSDAGPFVAWESQASESPAFQNKVTSTAIDAALSGKPFQAAFIKYKFKNASGATTTAAVLSATRREQQKR